MEEAVFSDTGVPPASRGGNPPAAAEEGEELELDAQDPLMEGVVVSPVKCVKNEIHNILTVLRLTRTSKKYPQETEVFLAAFQTLLNSLSILDEFVFQPDHLRPFIRVIESAGTNGPLTAVALGALDKFVGYNLIRPGHAGAEKSINYLIQGVLDCRFTASNGPGDEVVLLKILTVMVDLLRSPAVCLISDANIWGMVKKAYQISRQPKSSFLMKSAAENALQQLVLYIFCGCGSVQQNSPLRIDAQYKTLSFLSFLMSYGHSNQSQPQPPGMKPGIAQTVKAGPFEPSPEFLEMSIVEELKLPFLPKDESEVQQIELRSLGLSLLNVALETGGHYVARSAALLRVVQNQICHALLVNSRSSSLFLFSLTLRCVFNLFMYFKKFLKVQLEVFFNSIHLRLSPVSVAPEHAPDSGRLHDKDVMELTLESLLEFSREPEMVSELYLNYDCDVHSTNLFQRMVCYLSEQASPAPLRVTIKENGSSEAPSVSDFHKNSLLIVPRAFHGLHELAFDALIAVVESFTSGLPSGRATPGNLSSGRAEEGTHDMSSSMLIQVKQKKRRLEAAAQIFNSSPSKMITPLQHMGILPMPNATPESVVQFLLTTPGLGLTAIGDYLSKPSDWSRDLRAALLKTHDFRGKPLLISLREFLSAFRLPGEAQQIERLMEDFSKSYFLAQEEVQDIDPLPPAKPGKKERNFSHEELTAWQAEMAVLRMPRWSTTLAGWASRSPTSLEKLKEFEPCAIEGGIAERIVFLSADCIFVLAFSIIMLQTDQHNPQVKVRMTEEDFIKNVRGINEGEDLDEGFLKEVYHHIRLNPIKLIADEADTEVSASSDPESSWQLMLQKQTKQTGLYMTGSAHKRSLQEQMALDRDMLMVLWNDAHILETLACCFISSTNVAAMRRVLSGFELLVTIATKCKLTPIVSEVIATLCAFVNPWMTARSIVAIPVILRIAAAHASLLRTVGWAALVKMFFMTNALDLLPPSLRELDDYEDIKDNQRKIALLLPVHPKPSILLRQRHKDSRGTFGWLGNLLFSGGMSDDETAAEEVEDAIMVSLSSTSSIASRSMLPSLELYQGLTGADNKAPQGKTGSSASDLLRMRLTQWKKSIRHSERMLLRDCTETHFMEVLLGGGATRDSAQHQPADPSIYPSDVTTVSSSAGLPAPAEDLLPQTQPGEEEAGGKRSSVSDNASTASATTKDNASTVPSSTGGVTSLNVEAEGALDDPASALKNHLLERIGDPETTLAHMFKSLSSTSLMSLGLVLLNRIQPPSVDGHPPNLTVPLTPSNSEVGTTLTSSPSAALAAVDGVTPSKSRIQSSASPAPAPPMSGGIGPHRERRGLPSWEFAPFLAPKIASLATYRQFADSVLSLEHLAKILCVYYLSPAAVDRQQEAAHRQSVEHPGPDTPSGPPFGLIPPSIAPTTSLGSATTNPTLPSTAAPGGNGLVGYALWRVTVLHMDGLLRGYVHPNMSSFLPTTEAYIARPHTKLEPLPDSLKRTLPESVRIERLDQKALCFVERLIVVTFMLTCRLDALTPNALVGGLQALLALLMHAHPVLIILNRCRIVNALQVFLSSIIMIPQLLQMGVEENSVNESQRFFSMSELFLGLLLRCCPLPLPSFHISQSNAMSLPIRRNQVEEFQSALDLVAKLIRNTDLSTGQVQAKGFKMTAQVIFSLVLAGSDGLEWSLLGTADKHGEVYPLVSAALVLLGEWAQLIARAPPGDAATGDIVNAKNKNQEEADAPLPLTKSAALCLLAHYFTVALVALPEEMHLRAMNGMNTTISSLFACANSLQEETLVRQALLQGVLIPGLTLDLAYPPSVPHILQTGWSDQTNLPSWDHGSDPWMSADIAAIVRQSIEQQTPQAQLSRRCGIVGVIFRVLLSLLDSTSRLFFTYYDRETVDETGISASTLNVAIDRLLELFVQVLDAIAELSINSDEFPDVQESFTEYLKNLILVFITSPLFAVQKDESVCSAMLPHIQAVADQIDIPTSPPDHLMELAKAQGPGLYKLLENADDAAVRDRPMVAILTIVSRILGQRLTSSLLTDAVILLSDAVSAEQQGTPPQSEEHPPSEKEGNENAPVVAHCEMLSSGQDDSATPNEDLAKNTDTRVSEVDGASSVETNNVRTTGLYEPQITDQST